jgi:hypothetical protein
VRTTGDGQYVLIFDPVKERFVLHRVDSTFDMNLVSAPWEQKASALRSQYTQLGPESKPATSAPQRRPSKSAKNAAEKPKKPKPPVKEPTPEEEDSDDGFTVEYPDGPPSQQHQYQPAPVFRRNVSEDESDEDAEHESFEEERNQDVDHLQLPSPANNVGGMSDEEIELDLEEELEKALNQTENGADESSESEEE